MGRDGKWRPRRKGGIRREREVLFPVSLRGLWVSYIVGIVALGCGPRLVEPNMFTVGNVQVFWIMARLDFTPGGFDINSLAWPGLTQNLKQYPETAETHLSLLT